MPTRTKKFRGSRTHGRGKKAGRGAGKRGGRGNAGLHKHKYMYVVKYAPNHFGTHGFKRPPGSTTRKRTINLSEVGEQLTHFLSAGHAKQISEERIEIDLTSAGYDKLLGAGTVTKPIELYVAEASEGAIAKVERVGGKVILNAGAGI
jgi:large subunit ribosomal protein L15